MSMQAETLEKAYSWRILSLIPAAASRVSQAPKALRRSVSIWSSSCAIPTCCATISAIHPPSAPIASITIPRLMSMSWCTDVRKPAAPARMIMAPAGWSMASIPITPTCRSGNAWTTAAKKATPISR